MTSRTQYFLFIGDNLVIFFGTIQTLLALCVWRWTILQWIPFRFVELLHFPISFQAASISGNLLDASRQSLPMTNKEFRHCIEYLLSIDLSIFESSIIQFGLLAPYNHIRTPFERRKYCNWSEHRDLVSNSQSMSYWTLYILSRVRLDLGKNVLSAFHLFLHDQMREKQIFQLQ